MPSLVGVHEATLGLGAGLGQLGFEADPPHHHPMRGSVQTAVCVAEDAPRQGGGSGGRYRGNDRELHRGDGGWRLSSALMQPKYAYARLGVV